MKASHLRRNALLKIRKVVTSALPLVSMLRDIVLLHFSSLHQGQIDPPYHRLGFYNVKFDVAIINAVTGGAHGVEEKHTLLRHILFFEIGLARRKHMELQGSYLSLSILLHCWHPSTHLHELLLIKDKQRVFDPIFRTNCIANLEKK